MKSFFSKLGVLLLGATFAVVGCTDFAEDIREVGEKVDKVDNKVDNNVTEITVNTDAIEAKIKEMEAQHAADKKAAEEALAALKTTLDGKIKADIEAAEAKLTAAYEKADDAIKATAVADKAELKADVQKAADEALKAVAAAKAELEAAYKAADEEIKKAYAEADAKLKSDLEAEIATLKVELEKADAEQKKAIEEQIKALKDNLSKSEADLTKMVNDLETKLLQADADNKNALKLEIADLQSRLKDADAANKAELEKKINDLRTELSQIDAKNKQDIENKISEIATELRKADTDNKAELTAIINDLKVTLMGADAANKAELEKKISGFELSLLTARTELEKSITALENNFEKQIETINSSIKNLTESIANVEKEYKKADDVLRDEFAGADAALKSELNNEIDKLETALKNDDAALKAALELGLQSLGDELRKADVDNKAELTKQITDLAAALRSEDAAMEVALKEYADDIKAALEQADADNKAELLGLIAELESNLKDNKAELEKTIDDLAKELRKADSDLSDKVDNLEKTLRGETETVKQALEQKIADLATELREADSKLSDKVDNLEKTLRGETEEVKKALEKKIADLKVELLAADVALETKLQANIDKAVADAASALATAKADLTAAYQAADAALDAAIKENAKNIEENAKAIEELKDADDKLNAAILEVADARMIGDAVLEQKIKDEAIARAEAMQALQNANYASIQSLISMINVNAAAIEAEKVAREDAEAVLQQNIDAVAGDLAKARTDFEQADKDLKALIDKNAGDIATNLDEIVKLQGRATALEGRVAALESWRTTAMAEIAANASAISTLKTDLANLKTAYEAADAYLEQKIDAVAADLANYKKDVEKAFTDAADKTTQDIAAAESSLNNAISELSGKLTKEVNTLNGTITGVETALKALIEANKTLIINETDARIKADNEIKQTISDLEDAYEAADAIINKTLGELAQADKDNKAALEQKIEETAKGLNAKIDKAQTDLTALINAAKADFTQAITDEVTARNNAIAAIKNLIDEIKGNIATINGVNEAQNTRLTDLEADVAQAIADINDIRSKLGNIETRLGKAEEDIKKLDERIDSLFNQIQSIVYKPTHADGKARIDYATIGGLTLEGNSVITYKVYPTKHAETIVSAFNNGLTLEYDVETVTKAGDPDLEVVSVVKGKKAGEIDVTVKAVNLTGLYNPSLPDSYSAALVLNVDKGVENFSTEYTNLVANTAVTYDLKLVNYTPTPNYEIEYPQVVDSVTILKGIKPVFESASETLDTAAFFGRYPQAREALVITKEYITVPDNTYRDRFYVRENKDGETVVSLEPTMVDPANFQAPAVAFTTIYKYVFNNDPLQTKTDSETVSIADFQYKTITFASTSTEFGEGTTQKIPYTSDKEVGIMTDFTLSFGGKTLADLKDMGYAVKVDTAQVIKYTADPADLDLFEVSETIPCKVKLAKDGGLNKADAGDVGKTLTVNYAFDYKTSTDKPIAPTTGSTTGANVEIGKIEYTFDIELPQIVWTFDKDAIADQNTFPGASYCSREFNLDKAIAVSTDAPAAQDFDMVLHDFNSVEIFVDGTTYTDDMLWSTSSSPVKFKDAASDDGIIDVQLTELAWNKDYVVKAVFDRPSATVTLNFTVSTKDRTRTPLVVDDLTPISKKFAKNYTLAKGSETTVDFGLAERLKVGGYLGNIEGLSDSEYETLVTSALAGASVNGYTVTPNGKSSYDHLSAISTGIDFDPAFTQIQYGFNYEDLINHLGYTPGENMAKSYAYSASFTTFYGQEVEVNLGFNFTDPQYNYLSVYQYVLGSGTPADPYYVDVLPTYKIGGESGTIVDLAINPIDYFSTKQVDLDAAFIVEGEGLVYNPAAPGEYIADLGSRGLVSTFSVNPAVTGVTFPLAGINKLSYAGYADYAKVQGILSMMNDAPYNTKYPLDKSVYDKNGYFDTFEVRKFDPLGDLMVVGDTVKTLKVTESKVYNLNVLHNFSIKDKRGNYEIISSNENANDFVTGDGTNGFKVGTLANEVYHINKATDVTYNISVVEPMGATVAGISYNNANGTITIENDGELVYAKPVKLNVELSIKDPQTEAKKASYTLVITK